HRPARQLWLERLREPATPHRDLVLAIQGLAAVGEGQASERLRELVFSGRVPRPVRLEAAPALGGLRSTGLEKDAVKLSADESAQGLVGRLAAASLLRRHRSDDAVGLLQRLLRDKEPAVTTIAAARLLEIDAKHLLDAVESLLASADARLR